MQVLAEAARGISAWSGRATPASPATAATAGRCTSPIPSWRSRAALALIARPPRRGRRPRHPRRHRHRPDRQPRLGQPRRRARGGLRGVRPRARPHAPHPAADHRRRGGHHLAQDHRRPSRRADHAVDAGSRPRRWRSTSPRDNPTLTDIAPRLGISPQAVNYRLSRRRRHRHPARRARLGGRVRDRTDSRRERRMTATPRVRLVRPCLRPRSRSPSAIPSPTSCCRPTTWCATRRARRSCSCTWPSSPPSAGRRSASPLQPLLLLLIAASHFAIDWLKLRHGSASFGPFVIDQAAHLAMIALGATLFPGAYAAGLWAHLGAAARSPTCPQAMALGAGFVFTVWGGDYARPRADERAHARPTRTACPRAAG